MTKEIKRYRIVFKDIYGAIRPIDWDTLENVERHYSFLSTKQARKHGIADYWIEQKRSTVND